MNCPVCLSSSTVARAFTGTDSLFETTSRSFNFRGCTSCHCVFIDPIPGERELAGFYPERYWWRSSPGLLNSLEGWYRRIILSDHVRFVVRAAGESTQDKRAVRLLDVGCGSGLLLSVFKAKGFDVLGFDASDEAARIARAEADVDVITGTRLQEARFDAGSFDLVTLFHVMEHVPQPHEMLAEVWRLLRAGGRIVLQVPNVESWQFRLFGAHWYGLDVPRHVINYSKQGMCRLLSDCRFRILRSRQFNLRDNAPAFASSLFPGLDPAGRNVRRRQAGSEGTLAGWAKHTLYLSAVVAAYPFAIVESLAGAGATVMIEAEKF